MTTEAVEPTPLARWMNAQGMTDGRLAGLLGIADWTVGRYRRGERVPRPAILMRLVRLSGGALSVADFYAAADPAGEQAA